MARICPLASIYLYYTSACNNIIFDEFGRGTDWTIFTYGEFFAAVFTSPEALVCLSLPSFGHIFRLQTNCRSECEADNLNSRIQCCMDYGGMIHAHSILLVYGRIKRNYYSGIWTFLSSFGWTEFMKITVTKRYSCRCCCWFLSCWFLLWKKLCERGILIG